MNQRLLTIERLPNGARIDMPPTGTHPAFKRAPRAVRAVAEEPSSFDR
jgi:hypothetical protein